jgi:hypothetical protein
MSVLATSAKASYRSQLAVCGGGGEGGGIVVHPRITEAGKPVFCGKPRVGYVFVLVTKRYLRSPK